MSALSALRALLQPGTEQGGKELTRVEAMDVLLVSMRDRLASGVSLSVPEDLQLAAIKAFWPEASIRSFREIYLLCSALCLRHPNAGECLLENKARFTRILAAVEEWKPKPPAYRRCFQGLLRGYFTYDAFAQDAAASGQENWKTLRAYLAANLVTIKVKPGPDWVNVVAAHPDLFGDEPCVAYAADSLDGNTQELERIYEAVNISEASWFPKELFYEQIRTAARRSHPGFRGLLDRLLEVVDGNVALRHQGYALLLDRYVQVPDAPLHVGLRDAVVAAWGNPWLPSNEKRWGTVTDQARAMVADWLKLEFIETFFTKLADDGVGDTRRLEFWKRYIKAIDNIQFGLGPHAYHSRAPDFVELRKKMRGLISEIRGTGRDNNAFIMTMGRVVIVEFGSEGNAMYAYTTEEELPFDVCRPLVLAVDAKNSLKHTRHWAKWGHKDNIHGWQRWEDMFEASLRQSFSILPTESRRGVRPSHVAAQAARPVPKADKAKVLAMEPADGGGDGGEDQWAAIAAAMQQEYSLSALRAFARGCDIEIDDKTAVGGNLWLRTDDATHFINSILQRWGFHYKDGKGWWRATLHDR